MKAEITKEQKLAIVPESFTEDFALQTWLKNISTVELYLETGKVELEIKQEEVVDDATA